MNLSARDTAMPTRSGRTPNLFVGPRTPSTHEIRSDIAVVQVSRLAAPMRKRILNPTWIALNPSRISHWQAAMIKTKTATVRVRRHTTVKGILATEYKTPTRPSSPARRMGEVRNMTQVPHTARAASLIQAGVRWTREFPGIARVNIDLGYPWPAFSQPSAQFCPGSGRPRTDSGNLSIHRHQTIQGVVDAAGLGAGCRRSLPPGKGRQCRRPSIG